ncbi:MAG: hypothetical protein ABIV50_12565 [Opitutus sp.]
MNSAELPSPLHFLSDTSQWDDVRRIYRRVCVLRATGKADEATQLEADDLARALAVARIASTNNEDEIGIMVSEAERVSNAVVLAELLAPMLAEYLRVHAPQEAAAKSVVASAAVEKAKVVPALAPRPIPDKPPSIADFIDGMLSQEAPLRSSPAGS